MWISDRLFSLIKEGSIISLMAMGKLLLAGSFFPPLLPSSSLSRLRYVKCSLVRYYLFFSPLSF